MTPAQIEKQARERRETAESVRKGWQPASVSRPVFGPTPSVQAASGRAVNLLTGKNDEEERFPQAEQPDPVKHFDIPAMLEKPKTRTVKQMDLDAPLVIALENDVPIPVKGGRKRVGIYKAVEDALMAMQVGQSFVSPIPGKTTLAIIKTAQKKANATFWTRSIDEDKVRVWRVE